MSTNIVELKSYISVYDSVDRESGKTETEVHRIHFFESLPEGMKESPIQLSLCRYVKKYAMTAYDPDDIDNVCHCSQEEREAGFCNCFDFLEELPYRLKYLHEDFSISFRFSYDYGNFSPESVTVIQSSLSADDTEFLCGVIRAAYDVYYAQKNGLEGYPKYAHCFEGSFYEGMQAVYSFVPGFEVFRKIITIPDAGKQQKEVPPKKRKRYRITQEEAAKLVTRAYEANNVLNADGSYRGCTSKTIRNWEKEDRCSPPWYYSAEFRERTKAEFSNLVRGNIRAWIEGRNIKKPSRIKGDIKDRSSDN